MTAIIAFAVGGALLWMAAHFFGVDSRDGQDWREQPRP
jgi:hypothetical protein